MRSKNRIITGTKIRILTRVIFHILTGSIFAFLTWSIFGFRMPGGENRCTTSYHAGHASGAYRYPVSNEKNMNAKGYYKKLITSQKWVKLRAEKVANNPLCERCLMDDITTPAQEVHHIRPVESAPDRHTMLLLCFDYNNLQSLCSKCHKTVHVELQSYTKEEAKKRSKAKTGDFVAKFLKRHNPP